MRTWLASVAFQGRRLATASLKTISAVAVLLTVSAATVWAQPASEAAGGEASLKLPDLSQVSFFNGAIDGHKLLLIGILFCIFGLVFGLVIYTRLKNLPVHRAMREISELIYETCKTYLRHAGQVPAAAVGFHRGHHPALLRRAAAQCEAVRVAIILLLQPGGNRRQLRRGLVRHSRQHVRQLAHGVCGLARQAVSRFTRFRCKPA